MWWIYKCNSREGINPDKGNWDEVFASEGPVEWGTTEITPRIYEQAKKGDMLIAYQTNRNELVGTANVIGWKKRGKFYDLLIEPLETIRAKVRPLRQDPRIDKIPALQGGPIQTLYQIDENDAKRLLNAAKASIKVKTRQAEADAAKAQKGAGFGTAEENWRVEKCAIDFAEKFYRRNGWQVENVSKQNRGYDLLCKRNGSTLHVEVKGSRGLKVQFILTSNEKRAWESDSHFALALVSDALSVSPILSVFRGAKGYEQFEYQPISFVATLK